MCERVLSVDGKKNISNCVYPLKLVVYEYGKQKKRQKNNSCN